MILHVLIAMVAGWLQRHQQQVMTYLRAETRMLKAQLGDRRLLLTYTDDGLLKASGVEPIILPPQSPNLNAHCERCVRSIKEEAFVRMVMLSEPALLYVVHQYLAHYHTERHHQPDLRSPRGQMRRRERLGGLRGYYYRDAA